MVARRHQVVVDGSNIATEGRSTPSLAQLDEAVRAYLEENPSTDAVVVVDASFGHRIDEAERETLEEAELHGEVVAPPAGAIGRGDAFVLRIAERTGATVLSNDSFQEFHAEHPWLFDEGRLVGGKPVRGVGWIFTLRRPVRGPRSSIKPPAIVDGDSMEDTTLSAPRKAAEVASALKRVAKSKAASVSQTGAVSPGVDGVGRPESPPSPGRPKRGRKAQVPVASIANPPHAKDSGPASKDAASASPKRRARRSSGALRAAIKEATQEALSTAQEPLAEISSEDGTRRRRRRRGTPPPAVNEPLAFIEFVSSHPIGSELQGVVASFTSHGAMVDVALQAGEVMHCYVPVSGLGDPPPRGAREVLSRGEQRSFALVGLDPPRRMVELSLPSGHGPRGASRKQNARAR
ncbi:MAG: NYN domain-containing protein [Acidimicrobiales bacterium]